MKILYVEDNPDDIILLAREMERSSCNISMDIALNVAEAKGKLTDPSMYEVILVDMKLPDGVGLDLLSFIRRNNYHVSVIILTGYGDEEAAVLAIKAGADDYIAKKYNYYKRVIPAMMGAVQRRKNEELLERNPINVLYVEHNASDIELTKRHIERYSPHICMEITRSSQEALEIIPLDPDQESKIDIVLLDYRLPGLNAIDILKIIVGERSLDLPVIIISGQGDEEIAAQALKLGAADYLIKNDGYLYKLPITIQHVYSNQRYKKQHELLQAKNDELNHYFDNALDLLSISDFKGNLIRVNRAWTETLGYQHHEILRKKVTDLVFTDDLEETIDYMANISIHSNAMYLVNRYVAKNQSIHWIEWRSYRSGNTICSLGRDITERKSNEDKYRYLSTHDYLTGVFNRSYFEEKIRGMDTRENLPLSVVYADVNGLKLANDAFGHKTGDDLLRNTAIVLKKVFGEDTFVVRMGGDEFLVLLPHTSGLETEKLIAQTKRIASGVIINTIELSISFGWETKASEEESIEEILKKAENYMYRKKLVEGPGMRGKTIYAIINTLHEKNKREELHSRRVSKLCESIGRAMNFPEKSIDELITVGLLHDIGKIAINDAILNKEGKLTEDEWQEIKRHPEVGYRILSAVNDMADLAEYVLSHHERWDGRGYPRGLTGEEIPWISRVIALADTYDAITSERPYRKALSKEDAIYEIKKNAGIQFDPLLADLFVEKVAQSTLC